MSELKLNVQYVFKFYLFSVNNKYLIIRIRVKHTQFCFASFCILQSNAVCMYCVYFGSLYVLGNRPPTPPDS